MIIYFDYDIKGSFTHMNTYTHAHILPTFFPFLL